MVAIIVAMGIGVMIGAFGVIAWCLHESKKDKRDKDDSNRGNH